jgi:hypothetical protein
MVGSSLMVNIIENLKKKTFLLWKGSVLQEEKQKHL